MKRSAPCALFTVAIAICAAPALAQSVPEGQSCGGLLCDMGILGHKTPHDAAVMAPGAAQEHASVRHAEAATPPVAATPLAREPKKRTVIRRRVAKITAPAVAAVTRPVAAATPALAAAPVARAVPVTAPHPPPASASNVTMNPFVQTGPTSNQFRPLY